MKYSNQDFQMKDNIPIGYVSLCASPNPRLAFRDKLPEF